jgi:predicted Rossmann fold flavoprotein
VKIAIIGGGAAGFFAALSAKEHNPRAEVILIERTAQLLSKVKISGGGRCNVTHACFDPRSLVQNYPRGGKELLGPFHQFQPRDTVAWFQARKVELKTEEDGRMFPTTDSSGTVIDCLLNAADAQGVQIWTQKKLQGIHKTASGFELDLGDLLVQADRLILATGSARAGWDFARDFGHTIQDPVPSLFTFNIPTFSLVELAGVSVASARVKIGGSRLEQVGPLLITHWGFSGPAALKLSAFGARYLAEKNYEVPLIIDWIPELSEQQVRERLETEKLANPKKQISNYKMGSLPKSLWRVMCERAGISFISALNELGKAKITRLCHVMKHDEYHVQGKTTNKEEFVTCGGVSLSEVQFKTMESKRCEGLFFCGEVLDIDGVTGGFNFQSAWTTGWIAGRSAVS